MQSPERGMTFLLRTVSNPTSYVAAMREVIRQADCGIAMRGVNTLEEEGVESIAIVRIMGILMGVFGLVALALSSVGVYGVLSESVAQRTREIGIRLALGAHPSDLMKLVLGQALKLTGIGLAGALPLSFAVGRALGLLVLCLGGAPSTVLLGVPVLVLLRCRPHGDFAPHTPV